MSNLNHRLVILIGADCDPDSAQFGGAGHDERASLTWRGVEEGIPRFREIRAELERNLPRGSLQVTWCVRSDTQIAEMCGDYAYSYIAHQPMWDALRDNGDEIAWHCHLWRWSDEAAHWCHEADDEPWIRECMTEGYRRLRACMHDELQSLRMGWEFHNDLTMRLASEVGVEVDFSAMPGRRKLGQRVPDAPDQSIGHNDWTITTEEPYVPSRADFRRPARNGEESLDIWEIPRSTFVSPFWRGMSMLRASTTALRSGNLDRLFTGSTWSSPHNTARLSMHPRLVRALIDDKLTRARARSGEILNIYFHPDEMLPAPKKPWTFVHCDYIGANLQYLIEAAELAGVDLRFVTAGELCRILSEDRTPPTMSRAETDGTR